MPITTFPVVAFPPILSSEKHVVPLAVVSTALWSFPQLVIGPQTDASINQNGISDDDEALPVSPMVPSEILTRFFQSLAIHRVTASLPEGELLTTAMRDLAEDHTLAGTTEAGNLATPNNTFIFHLVPPHALGPTIPPSSPPLSAAFGEATSSACKIAIQVELSSPPGCRTDQGFMQAVPVGQLAFAARVSTDTVLRKTEILQQVRVLPSDPQTRVFSTVPEHSHSTAFSNPMPESQIARLKGLREIANFRPESERAQALSGLINNNLPTEKTADSGPSGLPAEVLGSSFTTAARDLAKSSIVPPNSNPDEDLDLKNGSPVDIDSVMKAAGPINSGKGEPPVNWWIGKHVATNSRSLADDPPKTVIQDSSGLTALIDPNSATVVSAHSAQPSRSESGALQQSSPEQLQDGQKLNWEQPTTQLPSRPVSLRLTSDTRQVQVVVADRGGKLQVAVRTNDDQLASGLRQDLGSLVHRLERTGYKAETWAPESSATLEIKKGQPNTLPSNDSPTSGEDSAQRRHSDEHPPRRQRPHWLEEKQTDLHELFS